MDWLSCILLNYIICITELLLSLRATNDSKGLQVISFNDNHNHEFSPIARIYLSYNHIRTRADCKLSINYIHMHVY